MFTFDVNEWVQNGCHLLVVLVREGADKASSSCDPLLGVCCFQCFVRHV